MAKVLIYGASDDLVEFEGAISDEFNAYGLWKGTLIAPNGDSLIVRAEFGASSESGWLLSVENTRTYPNWSINFTERPDREGDPAISIDIPDGTRIEVADEQ